MAVEREHDPSVAHLVGGVADDMRALLRQEIALARQELRENLNQLKTVGVAAGAGGALIAAGGLLLLLTLAKALADLFDWPEWAGYALVGAALAVAGALGLSAARKRARALGLLPERTATTLRENADWLRARVTGEHGGMPNI